MTENILFAPADTMPWTNSTGVDVVSGQVVVAGRILAVAQEDIANGETGAVLYKNAVARCPKIPRAVIAQGDTLTWHVMAGAFDSSAAIVEPGDITDSVVAYLQAAAGETTVDVVLNGAAGTIN